MSSPARRLAARVAPAAEGHRLDRPDAADDPAARDDLPVAAIDPTARDALLSVAPGIGTDPAAYGADARRCLTRPEAAILTHRP